MGAFQRRDDSFELRQPHEGAQRLLVRRVGIFHPLLVPQPRVLRPDRRVVQPRRDAMRGLNLAELILQNVGLRSLQHAERTALEPRRMFLRQDAFAARLDAEHLHRCVVEERIEQANGIRAAADARNEQVRQALLLLQNLPARFIADHALEIPDHHRIRMRAIRRAEDVMRAADIRHPVAHRLVHRLLQGLLPGGHRDHLGSEHLHAMHVERLPRAIDFAHVDDALHAEHRAHRRCGHTVLARARLGNDARLAHAFREKDLAHRVVDLVRAGVEQILALEVNLRPAELTRQALGEIQGRGTSTEFAQVVIQLPLKLRIVLRAEVFLLQLLQGMHQRFGNEPAAVGTEVSAGIRQRLCGNGAHSSPIP